MGFCGILWDLMEFQWDFGWASGNLWFHMIFHGILQWLFMGPQLDMIYPLVNSKLTVCYWKWPLKVRAFSYSKLWFSMVTLVFHSFPWSYKHDRSYMEHMGYKYRYISWIPVTQKYRRIQKCDLIMNRNNVVYWYVV